MANFAISLYILSQSFEFLFSFNFNLWIRETIKFSFDGFWLRRVITTKFNTKKL